MSSYHGTQAEENYIKEIFKLSESDAKSVSTNALARAMETSAASVTDMLKKLKEKGLVQYEKYKGAGLTDMGSQLATDLIRKHRLWEVFLVKKLNFTWDEVHEVAEQLEHIRSKKLVKHLDKFLDFPKFDPHGDPIPDSQGKINYRKQIPLSQADLNEAYELVGVRDTSSSFLKFLDGLDIKLGDVLTVKEIFEYDGSMVFHKEDGSSANVSDKVSENIYVRRNA